MWNVLGTSLTSSPTLRLCVQLVHPVHPAHPVHPVHPVYPVHPVHSVHPVHQDLSVAEVCFVSHNQHRELVPVLDPQYLHIHTRGPGHDTGDTRLVLSHLYPSLFIMTMDRTPLLNNCPENHNFFVNSRSLIGRQCGWM